MSLSPAWMPLIVTRGHSIPFSCHYVMDLTLLAHSIKVWLIQSFMVKSCMCHICISKPYFLVCLFACYSGFLCLFSPELCHCFGLSDCAWPWPVFWQCLWITQSINWVWIFILCVSVQFMTENVANYGSRSKNHQSVSSYSIPQGPDPGHSRRCQFLWPPRLCSHTHQAPVATELGPPWSPAFPVIMVASSVLSAS